MFQEQQPPAGLGNHLTVPNAGICPLLLPLLLRCPPGEPPPSTSQPTMLRTSCGTGLRLRISFRLFWGRKGSRAQPGHVAGRDGPLGDRTPQHHCPAPTTHGPCPSTGGMVPPGELGTQLPPVSVQDPGPPAAILHHDTSCDGGLAAGWRRPGVSPGAGRGQGHQSGCGSTFQRSIPTLPWAQERGALGRAVPGGCGCVARGRAFSPSFPAPRCLF